MVNYRSSHSELHTYANLVEMKYQGQFYQVFILKVRSMETLRVVVNRMSTRQLDIH